MQLELHCSATDAGQKPSITFDHLQYYLYIYYYRIQPYSAGIDCHLVVLADHEINRWQSNEIYEYCWLKAVNRRQGVGST